MLVVGFDTATPAVSVALYDGERVVSEASAADGRRHGELLTPMIAKVIGALSLVSWFGVLYFGHRKTPGLQAPMAGLVIVTVGAVVSILIVLLPWSELAPGTAGWSPSTSLWGAGRCTATAAR